MGNMAPLEGPGHLFVSLMTLGIFLHIMRIQSYFLRSERHDMKHIFQIFGLLGFSNNPIIFTKQNKKKACLQVMELIFEGLT